MSGPEDLPEDERAGQEPFQAGRPPTVHAASQGITRGDLQAPEESAFLLDAEGHQEVVLGDYVLLERIGAGGMGQVYKAQHRRMERLVAIKVLPRSTMSDPDAVQRFHREMRAAAKLFHPNIVTAFDAGEADGIHYLVMEYVEGQPLTRLVETRGPLPVEDAVSYILQAAQGLQYAHVRNMMHRDVKPSNLILTPEGIVKILDMGTARFNDTTTTESSWEAKTVPPVGLTHSGVIIGTVDYMAPEQARDARSADYRADIYSLGCTLHYLLIGKPVYEGDLIQTLLAHAQQPIPSLRQSRYDVPETLDAIFHRMLAKDPADRYQTMGEVMGDLQHCGVAVSSPKSPDTQIRRSIDLTAALRQVFIQQPRRAAQAAKLPAVGIDLGNSYASIAYLDETGKPKLLVNQEGQPQTPAAVMIAGPDIRIGRAALEALEIQGHTIACGIKRCLGYAIVHNSEEGIDYPAEALLALVLNKVANDARAKIGSFRHVVVSVPACFDDVRRKAVQDAAYIAGLEITHISNEPMAAAISFAYRSGLLSEPTVTAERKKLLVFHLGGGSCDATVIELSGRTLSTIATDGDTQLGGRDWDARLVQLMANEFIQQHDIDPLEDGNARERLYRVCESAKLAFSREDQASLAFQIDKRRLRAIVTRDKFKEETRDLVELVEQVITASMRAAHTQWSELSYILLTGGATRTPGVPEMLRRLTGGAVELTWLPDDAVAHGTALQAGARLGGGDRRRLDLQVRDVSSHSLGIVGIDSQTKQKHNAILIPRNTPLPATTQRVFKTHKDGQDSVVLQIIQGDEDAPEHCTPIGKCVIGNLPANLPAGSPITVEFHYSASGRLTVYIESSGAGRRLTKEINRASGLTNLDLFRWRQWAETMVLCSNT